MADQKTRYLIEIIKQGDGARLSVKELEQLDKQAARSTRSVGDFTRGMKQLAAALAIGKIVRDSVAAFEKQEQAVAKLNGTLRATGQFTQSYSNELQKMASALQSVTTVGDEAILSIQSQLISFGASREQLPRLTEIILDMVAAGRDLNGATMLVAKGLAGQFDTFREYGIVLDQNLTSAQKLEQGLRTLEQRFGGLARAQADTLSGSLQQTKNAIGDLQESLGALILEALKPTVDWLGRVAQTAIEVRELTFTQTAEQRIQSRIRLEEDLKRALDEGKISAKEYAVAMERLMVAFAARNVPQVSPGVAASAIAPGGAMPRASAQGTGNAALEQQSLQIVRELLDARQMAAQEAINLEKKVAQEAATAADERKAQLAKIAALEQRLKIEALTGFEQQRAAALLAFRERSAQINEITDKLMDRARLEQANAAAYMTQLREISAREREAQERLQARSKTGSLQPAISEAEQLNQSMVKIGEQAKLMAASGLADVFVDMFSGAKASFQEFASTFLREIARMILQALIFAAIQRSLRYFGLAEGGVMMNARGGVHYAANGITGVGEVSQATHFPKWNVVAGEAGREVFAVLAKPRTVNVNGMSAVVGNVGSNKLALTSARTLFAAEGTVQGGGGGGFGAPGERGRILIEVGVSEGATAKITNDAAHMAEVKVTRSMSEDSPLSRATRRLVE